MTRALAAALLLAAASCAATHRNASAPEDAGSVVGVYRVTLEEEGRSARHARLLLWAQPPDRLHADLSAPVGGVRFSLDAGDGRICLVDTREGVAYVGQAGEPAIRVVAGVDLTVAEAVAARLYGTAAGDLTVVREGAPPGDLPARLHVARGARAMTLERIKTERAAPSRPLGTGVPPETLAVRPLSELSATVSEGDGS